jgi:DNA-binding protein H-NS
MAKNSLNDLLAQKQALEKQIAEMQRETRGDAIAMVKSLMAEYGLTLADVMGPRKAGRPAGSGKGGTSGRKVAPKYRNAATGETWSGRGLKPRWLAAALAAGRSLSDFAI